MLVDKLIDIFAEYLRIDPDESTEDTAILYEYDLDEDQLEELADIITEETGKYTSPDMIESFGTIYKLAREMEDF